MRRVIIVTTGRSDFFLLKPVIQQLISLENFELRLIITGAHLKELSNSATVSLRNLCTPIMEVPCTIDNNIPSNMAESCSHAMYYASQALYRWRPDFIICLGDRFETFAIASAAFMMLIPIIHIHGGELSSGAVDDGLRHSISKFASYHATACAIYSQRLIAMGEQPDRIRNIGALGLNQILNSPKISRAAMLNKFNLQDIYPLIILTHHPVTLDPEAGVNELLAISRELVSYGGTVICTCPNSDTNSSKLRDILNNLVKMRRNIVLVECLGDDIFSSLLYCADLMIGNSSAGIIEAPFTKLPVVNVGKRQEGRLRHSNIIDTDIANIKCNIDRALSSDFKNAIKNMPYYFGDSDPVVKLVSWIKALPSTSLIKHFNDTSETQTAIRDITLSNQIGDRWAIIMAGGIGSRLGELTQLIPKPMLTVADKPILQHLVEHLVSYNVKHIFLSVNFFENVIRDHFGDGSKFNCHIEYLSETLPLGTGGGLSLFESSIDRPMLVLNGDLFTKINIDNLFKCHVKGNHVATVCSRHYSNSIPFGVLTVNERNVQTLAEKPVTNYQINAGIYIFQSSLFSRIPKNVNFPITHLIQMCLDNGESVGCYPMDEPWIDIGRPTEYQRAQNKLALDS